MEKKDKKKEQLTKEFEKFIDRFPIVELPVTLSEEVARIFSKENPPLLENMIAQFIYPIDSEVDEWTEFVPCFRLANTGPFYVLVYWKAGLMNYLYNMIVIKKDGELIDQRAIGGMFSDGEKVTRSIAVVTENMEILIASGQEEGQNLEFDPSKNTVYKLSILHDGRIVNTDINDEDEE